MRPIFTLGVALFFLMAASCGRVNETTCLTSLRQSTSDSGKNAEVSKIEFVGAKPEGTHHGGFDKFTVNWEKGSGDITTGHLTVDIETDSIYTDTPKLTMHLKSPDFFDVKKFPKATFVSTAITANKTASSSHSITGDLTLHGITKSINLPANILESAGGLTITGAATINRQDFGLAYGGGKINDDVALKFTVKASLK